jgi:NAD(P)-dependent dehydrogenase (short-subunit alcohol dehydrogenase family)
MRVLKPLSELISLKGKKALITGPALGIGRAMASRFAEAGADLELVDINERGLRAVAKEITQLRLGLLKTGVLFGTRLPLRRGGQPNEVARIAVVLASDLSSYVHGALIPVDGGFLSA